MKKPTIIAMVAMVGLSLSSSVFAADPVTTTTSTEPTTATTNVDPATSMDPSSSTTDKSLQTTTVTTEQPVDPASSDKKDQTQGNSAEDRLKNLMNKSNDKGTGSSTKPGSSSTTPSNYK